MNAWVSWLCSLFISFLSVLMWPEMMHDMTLSVFNRVIHVIPQNCPLPHWILWDSSLAESRVELIKYVAFRCIVSYDSNCTSFIFQSKLYFISSLKNDIVWSEEKKIFVTLSNGPICYIYSSSLMYNCHNIQKYFQTFGLLPVWTLLYITCMVI